MALLQQRMCQCFTMFDGLTTRQVLGPTSVSVYSAFVLATEQSSTCSPNRTKPHVLHCKGQKTTESTCRAAKHHAKLPNTTLTGMAAGASARHMQQKLSEKVIGVVPKGASYNNQQIPEARHAPKRSLLPIQ